MGQALSGDAVRTLKVGDRVRAGERGDLGTVAYIRNAPPDFGSPVAVSVTLDYRKDDRRYEGTIFAFEDVRAAGPECGHSACSQHFIDTGRVECVEPGTHDDVPEEYGSPDSGREDFHSDG